MKQRDILKFWLPLFASWLFLTAEGPLITTQINRLPNAVLMLAASGVVISLSVFIEAPVINMLSTSTAKVEDWASYRLVRRFTLHWIVLLTLIHVLMGYTPLFDVVVLRVMGIGAEIGEWVRTGMKLMVPWSAFIAWRRFLQGVLIKFGRTRTIAIGTFIRIFTSAAVIISLGLFSGLPGVVIAAITWITGVGSEALYASIVMQPLFKNELAPDKSKAAAFSYQELFWFHLPLAGSSILALLLQPMVVFFLARQPDSELTLAAWPLLFQILLMARSPALAMPEVIIALNKDNGNRQSLQRFLRFIAVAVLVATTIFIFTPLASFYLNSVQSVPSAVGDFVQQGLVWVVLFPALTFAVFGLRGFLISNQQTQPINVGMAINLGVSALVLTAGLMFSWNGIVSAAMALNASVVAELVYLLLRNRTVVTPRPAVETAG